MPENQTETTTETSLDGLWLVLVENNGRMPTDGIDGRVPMMARVAEDTHYLLGFNDMSKAQTFLTQSNVEGAEPRMVVKSNHSDYLRVAQEVGAEGILVDYNAETREYRRASEL